MADAPLAEEQLEAIERQEQLEAVWRAAELERVSALFRTDTAALARVRAALGGYLRQATSEPVSPYAVLLSITSILADWHLARQEQEQAQEPEPPPSQPYP